MLTYMIWTALIDDFYFDTTDFNKMGIYAFLSFVSIITISLDILVLPFELLGIAIFLITKKKGK